MSLRVPLTPDPTLQIEFHEIERRLRRLETRAGVAGSSSSRVTVIGSSGGGSVNLSPILARLDALEDAISSFPTIIPTYQDFGGVGGTSFHGLVPAPGTASPPTGVGQHLLTESGTWGFPFRGLAGVATSGQDEPMDVISVEAALAVAADLSAGDTVVGDLTVLGTLTPYGYLACCQDELDLRS